MNWGRYGILVVFGVFVLLLIFNPGISCFGKRIRSPFYPLLRKKGRKKAPPPTEDYGFRLTEGEPKDAVKAPAEKKKPAKKTEDYGFRLDP